MTKAAEAYGEAGTAIDRGDYLKDNFCKLRKYRKALANPLPSDIDQSRTSYERRARLMDTLNREIERRKTRFWSIAKPLLICVVGTVIGGIILFFLLRPVQSNIQKIVQPQPHQQLEELKKPSPSINPSTRKPDQLKQKTK